MMKSLMLAFAAPFVLSNSTPDPTINDGMPPVRFQGEAAAVVAFVNDVPSVCGHAPPPYVIVACASTEKPLIVMPNPCDPKFAGEYYAKVMCHEIGHRNGWPGTHGE